MLKISVETKAHPGDIDILRRGLHEHALPFTGSSGFLPLTVLARDSMDLVGGAHGKVNWNWLHISLLWVAPGFRQNGLGSTLLAKIESAACSRGCTSSHLDTFSYQAKDFYENRGYEVFARLEDYPSGYERIFLRKALV